MDMHREILNSQKKFSLWLSIHIIALSLFSIPSASAAVGDLDTSFDTDGKVTTAIGVGADYAQSVALQSDGKIIAAGTSDNGSNFDFAVVRYNTNGSLDTSFGTGGKVITNFGADDLIFSIALQGDGKIVVAGSSNFNFAVARYNTNGTLDLSFDTDGLDPIDFGSIDEALAVAMQSDGKIVVAGTSNNNFALARLNSDGTLDTSFDTDGKVTTAIGAGSDVAYSIVLQSDGKIIAAGTFDNGSNYDFAVVRYNTNGSPDTSFDTDGKVTTAIGDLGDVAYSIALQSDGKFVVAGISYNGSNADLAVMRYNTNGSPDTSFDTDGKVTTAIGTGDDFAYSIALQSDGKIVVAGYSNNGGNDDFALVRYIVSDSNAPAAPTLNSVTAGDRRVTVSFTAGANNGAAITDYEYSLNGGAYTSAGTSTSPFTITGLSGRTAYSVTIKARNSVGLSTASSSLSATTTDAPRDASEAATAAEAAKKAKEQKELLEILSIIPKIGKLALSVGDTALAVSGQKCVKKKDIRYVKKGAKCPKGFVKKK